jgi:hypothetical protein
MTQRTTGRIFIALLAGTLAVAQECARVPGK